MENEEPNQQTEITIKPTEEQREQLKQAPSQFITELKHGFSQYPELALCAK